MAESPFELAFRDQCATRPTERGDFYAGWSAALRWSQSLNHEARLARMDEFRVVAVVSHDDDCRHTEHLTVRSPDEAFERATNWPLSRGYWLVSAIVETNTGPGWTEYEEEQP